MNNHKLTGLAPEHLPSKYIHAVQLPGPDTAIDLHPESELLVCRVYQNAPTLFFLSPSIVSHHASRRRFIVVPAMVQGIRGDLTAENYVASLQMGNGECLHVLEVPLLGEPILPAG